MVKLPFHNFHVLKLSPKYEPLHRRPTRRANRHQPHQKIIRFGDILVNSTGVGTLGRVAQVYDNYEKCTVDSHVSILRPSEHINYDYFGIALQHLEGKFAGMGVGATGQTELSRSSIQSVEIVIPDAKLQKKFSSYVLLVRKLSLEIEGKNGILRKMRDLLIPQLATGKRELKISKKC